MDTGVFYVALGESYIDEAITSAKSVKREMPQMSIAIAADRQPNTSIFDKHIPIEPDMPNEEYEPTVLHIDKAPFEKTLFLDSDTYINDNIYEIFDLLEKFDILATHAPYREQVDVDVPPAFPEINGGVFAFNYNEEFGTFLSEWREKYHKLNTVREQPSLRKSIYESDLNMYILPSEYNCREAGYLHGDVKIFHRRDHQSWTKVVKKINNLSGQRLHYTKWGNIKIIPLDNEYIIEKAYLIYRRDGLRTLINQLWRKFKI